MVPLRLAAAALALIAFMGCARRYRVDGVVLRVSPESREMLVSHRPIDGYMPAMAMPFRVKRPADLAGLVPGSRVSFDLKVRRGSSRAAHVRRVAVDDGIPAASKPAAVQIGAEVPDFTLTDESERAVHLSDYRGRVVALDFIYTRCPLPDVCPRLSANFAALQKRVPGLVLISVTVDPEFDRPPVLAAYARRYGADPSRWKFLTGSLDDVRRVAAAFGMLFWNEESMIAHTAATVVIDRNGQLAAIVEGSSYRWEQLRDLVLATMQ